MISKLRGQSGAKDLFRTRRRRSLTLLIDGRSWTEQDIETRSVRVKLGYQGGQKVGSHVLLFSFAGVEGDVIDNALCLFFMLTLMVTGTGLASVCRAAIDECLLCCVC